jgi:Uma2 family endonuclease
VQNPVTVTEFLGWEDRQPTRFEFDGVQPIATTGSTIAHNRIMRRLHRAFDGGLKGQPCEPFGPDVKILVDGRARYPDAVVSCVLQRDGSSVIENPVVVFEELNESTSRTDRIEKVREYHATQSILRYVILEQDSIGATVFERRDETWTATPLNEGDSLFMPEISVAFPHAGLYADPRRLKTERAAQPGYSATQRTPRIRTTTAGFACSAHERQRRVSARPLRRCAVHPIPWVAGASRSRTGGSGRRDRIA